MNWIAAGLHKLASFFTSGKAEEEAQAALGFAVEAKQYVVAFMNSGYVPEAVIGLLQQFQVYDDLLLKYGQPVVDMLGTNGEAALKVLINLGVAAILSKRHNLNGTQALVAANTAYLEAANAA